MRSYLTLLSSRTYLDGVLVLNNSLKKVRSKYPLTVLITSEFLSLNEDIRDILNQHLINIKILKNSFILPESVTLKIHSKRWINTFDKLHVFGLTSFIKIIFLDSDMLVIRNIDHIFEAAHLSFATASEQVTGYENWTLPNSGMMVIAPQKGLPEKIFNIWPRVQAKKPDFSDQDLIHEYFREVFVKDQSWRLPALYNCFVFLIDNIVKERNYNLNTNKPDQNTIAVLHFAIKERPWLMSRKDIFKFYINGFMKAKFNEMKSNYLYLRQLSKVKK